jgi:hypothetical protein
MVFLVLMAAFAFSLGEAETNEIRTIVTYFSGH